MLITENLDSPKAMWNSLNKILHREKTSALPKSNSPQKLANKFLHFFADKISSIRLKLSPFSDNGLLLPQSPLQKISTFQPASLNEIRQIVFSAPNKQLVSFHHLSPVL